MKNHFLLEESPSSRFKYVSFSADHSRLDEYQDLLEKSLAKKCYEGEVLLDLLLSNGESSRRFFCAYFDCKHFRRESVSVARYEQIDSTIIKFCSDFYLKHNELLAHGVLSTAKRFVISNKSVSFPPKR
jgi:hypothetical protein